MRFHLGVSFRWKSIKKFLFPLLIGLMSYFGFSLFGCIPVFAGTNYNTSFNFSIPNYDNDLDSKTCGDTNMKNFIHNFISSFESNYSNNYVIKVALNRLNSLHQDQSITYGDTHLIISIYPKTYNSRNRVNFQMTSDYIYNFNYYHVSSKPWFSTNNHTYYNFDINIDTCSISPYSMNTYQSMITLLSSGTFSSSSNNSSTFSSSNGSYMYLDYDSFTNISVSDNTDVDLGEVFNNWLYYSSAEINFNQNPADCTGYCKALHINNTNTTYQLSDIIPTFWDIKDSFNPPTPPSPSYYIDYKDSLGTIYTNFPTNNVNNFDLNISFNTYDLTALQYNQNLDYTWGCYGRINHNDNYYTYEKFSYCDFESNGDYILDSNLLNLRFNNFHIYDSNDNIISNFSNYDKLFFYIDFQYKDSSLNSTISNLNISFGDNVYYEDYFSGPIYDHFNFPLYSKMLFSTSLNDYNYFYVKYSGTTLTNKYFLYKQQYNLLDKSTLGSYSFVGVDFQRLYANNNLNVGYMVYSQLSNQNSGFESSSLDVIINSSIIISSRDVSSNNFYYYDSSGTIVNNNFTINTDSNSTTSYNLDYYFEYLNDFMFNLSSKIDSFHDITQDFYNTMPIMLQSTLFILFILLCVYIIYREVRR